MPSVSLRVVTLNTWLLPLSLPGVDLGERLSRLPDFLLAMDADVIALQEVFKPPARRYLVARLRHRYHVSRGSLDERRVLRWLPMDRCGGLLLFSKFPIEESRFTKHRLHPTAKLSERIAAKGIMQSAIATPHGMIQFFNVHLYAGGSRRSCAARRHQLDDLVSVLRSTPEDGPLLVAGDFNTWPVSRRPSAGAYLPEYEVLLAAGLYDTRTDETTPAVTYAVPENRYAARWFNEARCGQRFDFVFYRPAPCCSVDVQDASVVLGDRERPLSDHYGYCAHLRMRYRLASLREGS